MKLNMHTIRLDYSERNCRDKYDGVQILSVAVVNLQAILFS